ncbi:hypothetical protein [Candidatus Mycoplasma haematominutum]|uniref:Uncharacterized protein n=1 Tax=Candidatus Mycoplasma haematominutum 'Birmingham 1' TaxID=1116213 RepID=G8C3C7_9MOLU|nr:hypothetical protein [Candidatus Mycoplasma haematominutum]CCE66825.1 hypothetical protein MHM_03070 [Candidatus Mycoplasma haematominutum 'Birmingham 1']
MIFTKYLFTAIAGLTGGVNALVFSSSGGALVSQELQQFENELRTNLESGDKLIEGEDKRLAQEKQTAEENFSKLDTENKNTQTKSRARRTTGEELQKSDYELRLNQIKQNGALEEKRKSLQSTLDSKVSEFKSKLESGAKEAFSTVQKAVQEETQKLSEALAKLQESNRQLIEKVKNCIEQLPQSIFVEASELKGKSYCDYVAEQKSKTAKS